jgi:MoaA/NifB/PqqE/SkfB family radical SAM enzyme
MQMWVRHARTATSHLSAKKARNLATNELEFRMKRTVLRSLPYSIKIETSAACHLRCPGCELGSDPARKHTKKMIMSLDLFKHVIDSLSDVLIVVSLSRIGEPLLNPLLNKMIAYCHDRNIGTQFPSSLSVKLSDEQLGRMIASGLDHLIVSIDGTTQEVYQEYRRGGNLGLVLKNVSTLMKVRERLGTSRPRIEFKFIVFEHNKHQLSDAKRLASDMGFDRFIAVLDNDAPAAVATMESVRTSNLCRKQPCFWPWNSMTIAWDGTAYLCCNRPVTMGTVNRSSIRSIWNNERYRSVRSFFRTQEPDKWSQSCLTCMQF